MRKLFICFFAAITALSCSDDDSFTMPTDPNEIVKLPCASSSVLKLVTQADVNYYAEKGYCSVAELIIGGELTDDNITDLTPLAGLYNVEGDVTIEAPFLESLEGLHNILNIRGDLTISRGGMKSLDGLRGLKTLGGDLTIEYSSSLENIAALNSMATREGVNITLYNNQALKTLGFNGVTTAGAVSIKYCGIQNLNSFQNLVAANEITIDSNELFTSLNGLSSITSIKKLSITQCPELTSIEGLENITRFESLTISYTTKFNSLQPLHNATSIRVLDLTVNEALTSLEGLNSLKEASEIRLATNDMLTSISALANLETIKSEEGEGNAMLSIINNNSLVTLNGLENITDFVAQLYIVENDALKDFCAVQAIVDNAVYPESISISGNQYQPDFTQPGGCSMD